MPPKKKVSAASATGHVAAGAVAGSHGSAINGKLAELVEDAIRVTKSHKIFKDIEKASALPIGTSGGYKDNHQQHM